MQSLVELVASIATGTDTNKAKTFLWQKAEVSHLSVTDSRRVLYHLLIKNETRQTPSPVEVKLVSVTSVN